jgi:hypothetical protein
MPLPTKIRNSVRDQSAKLLETGQRFTRFDQIRQRHFWSSYFFIPSATGYLRAGNYPVFIVPSGANGQGFPSGAVLTDRETNWKSQNRVPDNQNLEVTEIGVSCGVPVPSMDPQNTSIPPELFADPRLIAFYANAFNSFLSNTIVNITYLTNSVPLGLCADFAQASAPLFGTGFTDEENIGLVRSNGFAAPALRRRFKIPILLQHGETFAFDFQLTRDVWIGTASDNAAEDPVVGPNAFVARFDMWATESFVEKS